MCLILLKRNFGGNFGKKLMVVNNMEDGSEVIVKRFKRLVMDVLK